MPVVNREVVLPVDRERAWELITEPAELAAPLVEIGKKLTVGERAVLMRVTLEGTPESETARAAVRATTSSIVPRFSWLAVMSRKQSSSAPAAS